MSIRAELDAIVDKWNLLNHPFYQAWSAGTLPTEALACYAAEYGAFIRTVPQGWAAHGDMDIAAEESGHAVMWDQFARALNVSVDVPRVPEVKALVETADAMFRDAAESMGGLYAFEAQQPKTSVSKLTGLREHYNLPKATEPYFIVHCDDDHEPELLLRRIEALSPEDQRKAVQACEKVAEALWNGLTGIHGSVCNA